MPDQNPTSRDDAGIDALTGCADDQSDLGNAIGRMVSSRDHAMAEADDMRALLRDMIQADGEGVFGDPCWGERETMLWRRAKEFVK